MLKVSVWSFWKRQCRLCLERETLVAHQAELDAVIRGVVDRAASPKYVVLGTANRRAWRRGMAGGLSFNDVALHVADFKTYLRVDFTARGWYRNGEPTRTES